MTLDDLVRIAWNTYDNQHTEWDAMRAAVLTVLDVVERECVPDELPILPGVKYMPPPLRRFGYNECRAEVLRRLAEMKR